MRGKTIFAPAGPSKTVDTLVHAFTGFGHRVVHTSKKKAFRMLQIVISCVVAVGYNKGPAKGLLDSDVDNVTLTNSIRDDSTDEPLISSQDDETSDLLYYCDFNATLVTNESTICVWNLKAGKDAFNKTNWNIGSGEEANFFGGPPVDAMNEETGNYALFDVGLSRWNPVDSKEGWLVSMEFPPTDPEGWCLAFQYSIFGLGVDALQILLVYNLEKETTNSASGEKVDKIINYETSLLWERNDTTNGEWKTGHLSFTSQTPFQVVFSAVPSLILDKYEGYVAIDNAVFTFGPCPGDCSFESSFCSWNNVDDDTVQFQWSIGRGTTNTVTGPLRDHPSTESKRLPGGYAFIDSSYPRRSGDKAELLGPVFPAALVASEPYCLKFWMSAYGPKIGSLSVVVLPANCSHCTSTVVWKLRPEKLLGLPDLWILSQAVLVSPVDFRVRIDATVGDTGDSDIAIDDISYQPGVCPAMPSMAAPPGDCTFDDDLCGYTIKSIRQAPYSPPLWQPVQGSTFPSYPLGHTRVPKYKLDSYMQFDTNNYQHAPLDRARLLSPPLTTDGSTSKFCLTFWVNMFSLAASKVGLGALQVLVLEAVTAQGPDPKYQRIWRLNNHQGPKWIFAQAPFTLKNGTQIAFEGIEGLRTLGNIAVDDISIYPIYGDDSVCQYTPAEAQFYSGDCYFDTDDFCAWSVGNSVQGTTSWTIANSWDAPNFINDHTFGAPRSGFAFFNPAGQTAQQQAILQSPDIPVANGTVKGACFSFWFHTTGNDPDATLTVADRTNGDLGPTERHRIKSSDYSGSNDSNPQWRFGQVSVGENAVTSFNIQVYATSTYAVFALDDLMLMPGTRCATQP